MKRGRLNPVSKKRRAEIPARKAVVEAALERDGHRCQFWKHYDTTEAFVPFGPAAPLGCSVMLDVHEVIPRSAWAKGYLVLSNTVTLCRAHHDWVGDNPKEAHTIKLHGYSWERPSTDNESETTAA